MKIIIAFFLICAFSSLSFANETSSFKTATGQTITIGDSLDDLIAKTAQSPAGLKTTEWAEGIDTVSALSYEYIIGQTIYTVTVVKDKILKIEWTFRQ